MLRSVPRTAFLIVKPKPQGYNVDLTTKRVKKLEELKIHPHANHPPNASVSGKSIARNMGSVVAQQPPSAARKRAPPPPPPASNAFPGPSPTSVSGSVSGSSSQGIRSAENR